MKVVITRVKSANVKVNQKIVSQINDGLLVLVGFTVNDNIEKIKYIVNKIINLRIFNDDNGQMNKSLLDINGSVLSVSQFTLYADTKKGRRPSYEKALKSEEATKLYQQFNQELQKYILTKTGIFGEDMQIESINDGPVTIIIEN